MVLDLTTLLKRVKMRLIKDDRIELSHLYEFKSDSKNPPEEKSRIDTVSYPGHLAVTSKLTYRGRFYRQKIDS